jgi:hypothetical protein
MFFRSLLLVLGAGILSLAQSAAAQSVTGCSAATAHDSMRVHGVLAVSAPEVRVELGLDSARMDDVQALSMPSDAAVCRELRRAVEQARTGGISPSARLSYFRSGALFFVVYSDRAKAGSQPTLDGGDGRVYILGRDLKVRTPVRA